MIFEKKKQLLMMFSDVMFCPSVSAVRSWLPMPGSWRGSSTVCPATTRWVSPSAEPVGDPSRAVWSTPWASSGMWRCGIKLLTGKLQLFWAKWTSYFLILHFYSEVNLKKLILRFLTVKPVWKIRGLGLTEYEGIWKCILFNRFPAEKHYTLLKLSCWNMFLWWLFFHFTFHLIPVTDL